MVSAQSKLIKVTVLTESWSVSDRANAQEERRASEVDIVGTVTELLNPAFTAPPVDRLTGYCRNRFRDTSMRK